MLQAYKKFNSTHKDNRLNLSALGFHEENSVIYINELLTKKGKNLHYLARKLIKGIDWKFCWTSRGKIFIRKEEGQPAIEIKSDEQISTLNKNSTVETTLAWKHTYSIKSRLYNRANKDLKIYPLTRRETKHKVTNWLKSLDYDASEALIN
ncbi:hypothetical protein K1T71_001608 [Dendrolimus kikuchii]|uniref:Uncharacterized protein n=1 Tax=Dendrolimus kikuchii TaxID=765133 RepID=A0ACC1DE60_9NEOP|nr:hypothetical protein K1T71_001608 [Dendrolimus kikuchii]